MARIKRSTYEQLGFITKYGLEGVLSGEDICGWVASQSNKVFGVADRGYLTNVVPIAKAAAEYDVKVIYGVLLDLKIDNIICTLRIYAKNDMGFRNMVSLSNFINNGSSQKYVSLESFEKKQKGLIYGLDMVMKESVKETTTLNGRLISVLKNSQLTDFHLFYDEDLLCPEIKKWLIDFSEVCRIAPIRSVSYIDRKDEKTANMKKAIHENRLYRDITATSAFSTTDADCELAHIGRSNLLKIISSCEFRFPLHNQHNQSMKELPDSRSYLSATKFPSGREFTYLLDEMKKRVELYEELERHESILYESIRGFYRYYQHDQDALNRFITELNLIIKKGYLSYFVNMMTFVKILKRMRINYSTRGSVGACLFARTLGITDLCPIENKLLFERFLNEFRYDFLDIDIDVESDRRGNFIKELFRIYKDEHVAQLLVINKFGFKNALRYSLDSMGYSGSEIESALKAVGSGVNSYRDMKGNLFEKNLMKVIDSQEHFDLLSDVLPKLENLPFNYGKHAAGLVISKKTYLTYFITMHKLDNKTGENFPVLLMTKNYAEDAGYVKFDILSADSISKRRRIMDQIVSEEKEALSFDLNDPKVYQLIGSGLTKGIFQLESNGIRDSVKRVRPSSFIDLMVFISLYRPGPIKLIPSYVYRKKKNLRTLYTGEVSQSMEAEIPQQIHEVVADTFGVIVFQEQVIQIVSLWSGMSFAKADRYRRGLSAKNNSQISILNKEFYDLSISNGRDDGVTKEIQRVILRFSEYGYNRAHAAQYAYNTFIDAWLKTYYPVNFIVYTLNEVSKKMKSSLKLYLTEGEKLGFTITSFNINKSEWLFRINEDTISFGFCGVKFVGENSAEKIILDRKENGYYYSAKNFRERASSLGIPQKAIEEINRVNDWKEAMLNHSPNSKRMNHDHYSINDI